MGETTSCSTGERMKEAAGKGKKIEGSSSQHLVPYKRGKTRLIKKPEETQVPNELLTQYVSKNLLVHAV
jgi:hypothetical protein